MNPRVSQCAAEIFRSQPRQPLERCVAVGQAALAKEMAAARTRVEMSTFRGELFTEDAFPVSQSTVTPASTAGPHGAASSEPRIN